MVRPNRRTVLAAAGTTVTVGGGLVSTTLADDENENSDERPDGWSAYHGNPGNTGFAPHESGPEPPVEIAWRYEYGGPTAVVDGVVYVQTRTGEVHALDADDGLVRWTSGDIGAAGGLSVADDAVFVGGEQLTALDAETGSIRWTVDEPVPEPAVAHEAVYTITDTGLTAFDVESGDERWSFAPGADEALYDDTSVAVADGAVFGVSPRFLFARSAEDGSERWTYDSGEPDEATGPRFHGVPQRIAATEELVAVPEFSGPGVNRIGIYDIRTGAPLWRTTGGVEGAERVTITDDYLFVRGLYLTGWIDRETRENEGWFEKQPYGESGLPAVGSRAIYIGHVPEDSPDLSAIDRDDGSTLWALEQDDVDWDGDSSSQIYWQHLAIGDETLYASTQPDRTWSGLVAIRTETNGNREDESEDTIPDTDEPEESEDDAAGGC